MSTEKLTSLCGVSRRLLRANYTELASEFADMMLSGCFVGTDGDVGVREREHKSIVLEVRRCGKQPGVVGRFARLCIYLDC
jgi:hypothetical protein